ncbi:MAG: hypothetical protein EDM82_15045 [Cyanobacteria bacterium CYA]|nr:MAG: hypothetical protein EDM82_15045 [Cyanobacteria bacterium CYA]
MGVIGILITILLPVVLPGKRHAQAAAGTANLRSLSQIMGTCTTSNREASLNLLGAAPDHFMHAVSPLNPSLHRRIGREILSPNNSEAFACHWHIIWPNPTRPGDSVRSSFRPPTRG